MLRAPLDAARERRATGRSPCAAAPLQPGRFVARRSPRRGAARSLLRRTLPSRSPRTQPPQAPARVSADRPSHSVPPGRPPDAPARARSRARHPLSERFGERDTRPRGMAGRSPGRARRPRKGAARHRRIAETTSRRSRDSSARPPAVQCLSGTICLRSTHQASSPAPSLRRTDRSGEPTPTAAMRSPPRVAWRWARGALWTWDSASAS